MGQFRNLLSCNKLGPKKNHVTKSFIDGSNSHNLSKGANSSTCDNKLNALHHAKLTNIHFGFN